MSKFKNEDEVTRIDVSTFENIRTLSVMGKGILMGLMRDTEYGDDSDVRKATKLLEFAWEFLDDMIETMRDEAVIMNDLRNTLHEMARKVDNLEYMVKLLSADK